MSTLLVKGVWIVNKVVGVGWCDAPECKVAPAFYSGGYMPKYVRTLKYYASLKSNNKTI